MSIQVIEKSKYSSPILFAYPKVKELADRNEFFQVNIKSLPEYFNIIGIPNHEILPLNKMKEIMVQRTIPIEAILEQSRWYTRLSYLPLISAIYVYISDSSGILKESRFQKYKGDTGSVFITDLVDSVANDDSKKDINSPEYYENTIKPIFSKWGIKKNNVYYLEQLLEAISQKEYYNILYRGIITAPRPKKPFVLVRYSSDYEMLKAHLEDQKSLYKPLSAGKIGDIITSNTILSTSYMVDKYWEVFANGDCAYSCCLYVINVPANFPCLFINRTEREVLLPPYCKFRIDRFRLKETGDKPSIVIKERITSQILKKLCESEDTLIIDVTIVGIKTED
jgi:hypothetical protein